MRIKYTLYGHRVICDGKNHRIFKKDGSITINPCSCNIEPNSDPKYWQDRQNKGCRCPSLEGNNQCQYPELHEGNHLYQLI